MHQAKISWFHNKTSQNSPKLSVNLAKFQRNWLSYDHFHRQQWVWGCNWTLRQNDKFRIIRMTDNAGTVKYLTEEEMETHAKGWAMLTKWYIEWLNWSNWCALQLTVILFFTTFNKIIKMCKTKFQVTYQDFISHVEMVTSLKLQV